MNIISNFTRRNGNESSDRLLLNVRAHSPLAQAIAEGVREIPGAEVILRRVPETLSAEVLEKMGAVEPQKTMANVPVCTVDELATADAIIFGTPTRFGNMCGQMRQFLDATGQLGLKEHWWAR